MTIKETFISIITIILMIIGIVCMLPLAIVYKAYADGIKDGGNREYAHAICDYKTDIVIGQKSRGENWDMNDFCKRNGF